MVANETESNRSFFPSTEPIEPTDETEGGSEKAGIAKSSIAKVAEPKGDAEEEESGDPETSPAELPEVPKADPVTEGPAQKKHKPDEDSDKKL